MTATSRESANSESTPKALVFEFDLGIVRLAAIKKAAYRFTADYEVEFKPLHGSGVQVILTPRRALSQMAVLHPSFPNEVLDQELRELVADETKPIRDLIMAQTFSELSLTDPIGEEADYHEDPLGILNSSGAREKPK